MSSFVSSSKSADTSLTGSYASLPVKCMVYGRGCSNSLPSIIAELGASKAFIITGQSLLEKTPVIKGLQALLGDAHVGTYAGVRQHAKSRPVAGIEAAIEKIQQSATDILISVGGGSPIDTTKAVAYHIHEKTGKWLPHITIPTTLSVAETTRVAGFTDANGHKVSVVHHEMAPKVIVYDADLTLYTPTRLWLSSAIRAIDHAVELQYHPQAPEVPVKRLCLSALQELFVLLPLCHQSPDDADIRQRLQIATYSALPPFYFTTGLGLSHTIGHVIGATYAIPHGITSCISLAKTVHFKADHCPEDAKQIAKIVPYIGLSRSGDDTSDAHAVGNAISALVHSLGLKSTLSEFSVKPSDAETIAARSLKGDEKNSQLPALVEMIRSLL
ncbi:hypothetical protein FQN57_007446 [Myotisia sp. PD_48]|nr:hypothetical protein FQN57_007446 [Myotisia sp. PD_48]